MRYEQEDIDAVDRWIAARSKRGEVMGSGYTREDIKAALIACEKRGGIDAQMDGEYIVWGAPNPEAAMLAALEAANRSRATRESREAMSSQPSLPANKCRECGYWFTTAGEETSCGDCRDVELEAVKARVRAREFFAGEIKL